jgi:DNA-binding response OmpR family regulator
MGMDIKTESKGRNFFSNAEIKIPKEANNTRTRRIAATILLLEDNDFVRNVIRKGLEADGYRIMEASDIRSARRILKNDQIDLVLMDLQLPDGNGLEFMPEIQNLTDVPIIIVSSKDAMIDKVVGLELGADDYINKPVEMRELSARIKANIRRYKAGSIDNRLSIKDNSVQIKFGKWIMDCSRYQIFYETGEPGNLTVKEFQLLEALVKVPGHVLTREHLFSIAREENSEASDRAVDIQITRIRKKIGDCARDPQIIKTIRGIGYVFEGKTETLTAYKKRREVHKAI